MAKNLPSSVDDRMFRETMDVSSPRHPWEVSEAMASLAIDPRTRWYTLPRELKFPFITWRIIPFSKCLKTMGIVSPLNGGNFPFQMAVSWLINRGDPNRLLNGMILQVKALLSRWFSEKLRYRRILDIVPTGPCPKDHWTLKTGYFEDPTPAIQVQTLPLEGPRSLRW